MFFDKIEYVLGYEYTVVRLLANISQVCTFSLFITAIYKFAMSNNDS